MNKVLSLSLISLLSLVTFVTPVSANKAALMGGNFMTGFNNTTQTGTWRDPVEAAPQNNVEFRIQIRNEGDETMERVQVWAVLPSASSTELITTGGIRTNNVTGANAEVGDTVKVNVTGGSPVGLRLLTGHTRFFGVTNLHNCPNGCDIPDTLTTGGLEVGNVTPGQELQVAFKAFLTQAVTASPAPSPSVAPSTPPASAAPTQTQTQTQTVNVTQNNNAPAVAGVKTLPKTGLPLAALVGLGALPAGLALKKFRKSPASEDAPESIWEDRQIKLDS